MQFPPSPHLSNIVKHYLIVENGKDIPLNYRLFSDGNPGIVFHFKDPLIYYPANGMTGSTQPASFMYGQITHYNDLISGGELGMLVVVLQPYGIYTLLRTAAYELNDNMIRLADLFGQAASDLEDRILNADNASGIIGLVENFLFKRAKGTDHTDPFVREAVYLICRHRGILTVEDLLKKIPVTERQLERKFKEQIGASPKKISDLIRFHNFLKLLQKSSADGRLSDIIYDGGYYDQAHLNNYCKKITGLTPSQYKTSPHRLAVNFMQLPGRE